jgi:DNA polymerase-1
MIVGHAVSFDMAVLLAHRPELAEMIWELYALGRVRCTRIREKLLDIAEGTHGGEWDAKGERKIKKKYSLADIVLRRFGEKRDKETWRTGYAELDGVPFEKWPQGAIDYAVTDATDTLRLHDHQEQRAQKMRYPMPDQSSQARADLCLRLMSVWGIRTDGDSVEALKAATDERFNQLKLELQAARLVRFKRTPKGKESKNLVEIRALVERSYSGPSVPRTNKGAVKTDADTLELCDDPLAATLHEYVGLEKSAGAFVNKLREGVEVPIHPSFNVLVNSGRTSSSNPNIQQQPRVPGVRECFKPRDGWVFLACDYDSQELRTWAQVCLDLLGQSTLAERYREDPDFDPHLAFAAGLLQIEYAEAQARKKQGDPKVKEYRQQAKPANFGFPVGMSAKTFRTFARGYGLIIDEDRANTLRNRWYKQWPESKAYFEVINQQVGQAGEGDIIQLRSGRKRGLCRYTVAANTYFQGLAADASKLALWWVTRACYTDRNSPLFGCRPVIFLHDEIIMEAPESYAHLAATELERVMVKAMQVFVPDVPCRATAALMRRWAKEAEPAYINGKLVPYEDVRPTA